MSITAAQVKEARRLLGWSQMDLSLNAGVSLTTISAMELGKRVVKASTLDKLQAVFEAAGVEFIAENGSGAGVKLRKGMS